MKHHFNLRVLGFSLLNISFFIFYAFIDPFSIQLSSDPEACPTQGSISINTIDSTLGATFVYHVYKAPDYVNAIRTTSEKMISGLTAGDYRVIATQSDGTESNQAQADITIEDELNLLSFDVTTTPEVCGNDGEIIVDIIDGIADSFAILSGPVIFPFQDSSRFINLVEGSYRVAVKDKCGEIIMPTDYLVAQKQAKLEFFRVGVSSSTNLTNCDSVNIGFSLSEPIDNEVIAFPLTYELEITYDHTSDTHFQEKIIQSDFDNSGFTVPFYNGQNNYYSLSITDRCNNRISQTGDFFFQKSSSVTTDNCLKSFQLYSIRLKTPLNLNFLSTPFGFNPNDYNLTYPGPYGLDYNIIFGNELPVGDYSLEVKDECSYIDTLYFSISNDIPELISNNTFQRPTCQSNYGSIYLDFQSDGNFAALDSVWILAGPSLHSNNYPINAFNNIYEDFQVVLGNLQEGTYTFRIKDVCGAELITDRIISGLKENTPHLNVELNCGSFDISFSHSTNAESQYLLQFQNESSLNWEHPNTGVEYSPIFGAYQLSGIKLNEGINGSYTKKGNYRVLQITEIYIDPTDNEFVSICDKALAEFTFTDSVEITSLYGFDCGDGLVDVAIDANGIDPITYKIISKDGDVSFTVDNGTDPVFNQLAAGLYTFEIEDDCNTTFIRQYDVTSLTGPQIIGNNICDGAGTELFAADIPAFNYSWWKEGTPSTELSDSAQLIFDNLDIATDTGTYLLRISYDSPQSCIDDTLSYRLIDNGIDDIRCQDITVYLDDTGSAAIVAGQVNNGSSDDCGIRDASLSQSTFDCTDLEDNIVYLRLTNNNGVVDSCLSKVTVRDTINPVCNLKSIEIYLGPNGIAEVIADSIDNESADNCSEVILSVNPRFVTCDDVGEKLIDVMVSDQSGNITDCQIEIMVIDTFCSPCITNVSCAEETYQWSGHAVVTCSGGSFGQEDVAGIININDYNNAPKGDNWSDPSTGGASPVSMIKPSSWTIDNLGQVFGASIGRANGNIFLAASNVYAYDGDQYTPVAKGPGGELGLYKTNFGNPSSIATLVTTSNTFIANPVGGSIIPSKFLDTNPANNPLPTGWGNISYDELSNTIYGTNLSDGRIYAIDSNTGIVKQVYDPFGQATDFLTTPFSGGEVLWGIELNECNRKLYFVRQTVSGGGAALGSGGSTRIKEIYSIAIDRDGEINIGSLLLELTVNIGTREKITDLDFNGSCDQLILSERGTVHNSLTLLYQLVGNTWTYQTDISVGSIDGSLDRNEGLNSTGGVSFGPDSLLWTMGDCLDPSLVPNNTGTGSDCNVYGPQGSFIPNGNITDLSGDLNNNSLFIDLQPGIPIDPRLQKFGLGDIEIFGFPCASRPCPFYDLAISKSIISNGPYAQDGTVTFSFTVENQGTIDASNIQVTDFPQSGLVLVSSDEAGNPNVSRSGLVYTIASLPAGRTQSVNMTFRIDPSFQGSSLMNIVEITTDDGDDIDSNPDLRKEEDDGLDGTADNIDDDEDMVLLPVVQTFDLALRKTLSSDNPSMFSVRDTVSFDIEVFNQGTLDAQNIVLKDFVSTNMENVDGDWPNDQLTISSLSAGSSTTVSIDLKISESFQGTEIVNNVEIIAFDNDLSLMDEDSDIAEDCVADVIGTGEADNDINDSADGTPGTTDNPNDADECDFAVISVQSCPTPTIIDGPETVCPNSLISYSIDLTGYNSNISWSYDGDGSIVYLSASNDILINYGSSPDGGIIRLYKSGTLVLTKEINIAGSDLCDLINCANVCPFLDEEILNLPDAPDIFTSPHAIQSNGTIKSGRSVIFKAANEIDLLPGFNVEENAAFEALIEDCKEEVGLHDLSIDLSIITLGPYDEGDLITIEISLSNEGELNVGNIGFNISTDDNLVFVSDNTAVQNSIYGSPILYLDRYIESGDSHSITASYRIKENPSSTIITIIAEIIQDSLNDKDSDPSIGRNKDDGLDSTSPGDDDGGNIGQSDDDDEDMVMIEVNQNYDLAISKSITSNGPYAQNSTVTLSFTVENQGTIDASNIQVTDFPQSGLIFVSSDEASSPNVSRNGLVYTIASLPAGRTQSVNMTFSIDPYFQGSSLMNVIEITADDGVDIDSDPDLRKDEDDGLDSTADNIDDDEDMVLLPVVQTFDLALRKTLSSDNPSMFFVGDTVSFDIEVFNQGTLDATRVDVVDFVPNGLTIIRENGWGAVNANNVTRRNNIENLSGGNLNSGERVLLNVRFVIGTAVNPINNFSEIILGRNILDIDDCDSNPDAVNNDTYIDDFIGNDCDGHTIDEDDHDIETIIVDS